MTLLELARKVKAMRDAQRRWFGGDKSSATLEASRRLEREIDRDVAEVLGGQASLFGGER